ncbi:MAG: hypothetical protein M3Z06_16190 [Actinomycetota bacterium]|nr:hypothetical protein [Actinomycetota bacterium]
MTRSTAPDPNTPVIVLVKNKPPSGYRLTANQAKRIALRSPKVVAELRRHPTLIAYEYTKGPGRWQVSWFNRPPHQKELTQVYVDDASGRVTEAWTGFQVAWTMARGYPGAFGRKVNSWYVWLPLCLLFLAPFIPWRRRPTLLHLDLLVLLGFSVSLAFFNHALIGISVPLAYPFLLYLLVRMLLLAFGRGRPREPLRLLVPVPWLAVALIFLVGFRVGLNVTDSNAIDVGYAGVIGADKLIHGKPLYGHYPSNNPNGDTYGPVDYYAYVPARAIFGWSGAWDDLPAAHAAAIAFDLLTLVGLFLLGRRVRGPTTGIVLAYAWAAYPFTLYALSSNSNDSLVALLIVLALLLITWAPVRGVTAALGGLTKFAPLALGPLFLRGQGDWPRKRSLALYVLAYALTLAVALLPVILKSNLHAFWHDSIAYQAGRGSPFSIWGLWGGLGLEQHLVQGTAAGLGVMVAFVPRRRTLVEVAALAAAVLIALQLGISHWFYLYIPWFFPLVMLTLIAAHPSTELPWAQAPAPAGTSGERPSVAVAAPTS